MKYAVLFIISLYISLPSVAILPVLLGSSINSAILFRLVYLLTVITTAAFLFFTGIASIIKSAGSDSGNAVKMWRTMKLASIPAYIANFLFFGLFGVMMFPATVITGFISGFFCCSAIVLSGMTGIAAIRKLSDSGINKIHCILQFVPVLDVISTVMLIRK